jgi:glycosyltransferase involved in cell wall biosynthesis
LAIGVYMLAKCPQDLARPRFLRQRCQAKFFGGFCGETRGHASDARSQENVELDLGLVIDTFGHYRAIEFVSRTDVVVIPTYYGEGLPTTLVEAAASELPLITTDGPGCPEVVSCNSGDGLPIPLRDCVALGTKIGLAARKKALREFDELIVLGKTLAVHGELLRGLEPLFLPGGRSPMMNGT